MRNTEYQFVSTDTEALVTELTALYESIVGMSVQPASPERLFILWVATAIVQERIMGNYIGNQNIPSRAEGENLDALAELFFVPARPRAQSAYCTVRFRISAPQANLVLVPVGTRVTDTGTTLTWATEKDAYIPVGETHADILVRCQTPGVVGNGYTPGQIDTLVDLFSFSAGCENITESEGGTNTATDDEFYELMRSSMDAMSAGGARGSYIYYARQVSTEIADVAANSPSAGRVAIYVLMENGEIAGTEIKNAVLEACNKEDRRPLTDLVTVADPSLVNYNIDLTYYIRKDATASSTDIEAAVNKAVAEYVAWQCGKLGRDINPDELLGRIRETGNIKRVVLRSPSFTPLRDGSTDGDTPQVARVKTINLVNGGFEDE